MRQTLLYIPHELFGIPVFGLGWAFGIWLAFSVILLIVLSRRHGWTSEVLGYLPLLGVFGFAWLIRCQRDPAEAFGHLTEGGGTGIPCI